MPDIVEYRVEYKYPGEEWKPSFATNDREQAEAMLEVRSFSSSKRLIAVIVLREVKPNA
jgi:hypothetical protein